MEVKVGSDFRLFELPDGRTLAQPDYYRWAWQQQPAMGEAAVRAVGTLTRDGGTTAVVPGRLCARDVSWFELRDRLALRLDRAELEPEVQLVAESFLEAIRAQIAIEPPDPHELRLWLARHKPVVEALAAELVRLIPDATATSSSGAEYVARRIQIDEVLGKPLVLRVYATPAGSGLTLPGWPDGVIVGIERDANGTLDDAASSRFQEHGFLRRWDVLGFWLHRELWPMDDARRAPRDVAAQIAERLASTGLIDAR